MTLGWIIAGTFAQFMLAGYLFMAVAFGAGGIGASYQPTPFGMAVINSALYVVPASCILSAMAVVGFYFADSGFASYYWYLAPFAVLLGYVVVVPFFLEPRA